MATPVVETSTTDGAGSGTGGAIALPSGIQAGDKLVVLVNINNSLFSTTVTGWTKIVDYSFVPVLSLTPRIGIFVRDADGTETTFAQTWTSSVKWSSVSYRISGSDSVTNFVLSTEHTASDSTADANNLAPGSTKDWLWIYLGGSQNTYTVASPATGYTNLLSATSAGGGSANSKATCWSCTKGTTATSSEDPPAWSLGTAVGHAEWVLAVPPGVVTPPLTVDQIMTGYARGVNPRAY